MNESPEVPAEPTSSSPLPANLDGTLPRAGGYLNATTRVVEIRGPGDAWQIISSTNGHNFHGKKEGDGWRTWQFVGNCRCCPLTGVRIYAINMGRATPPVTQHDCMVQLRQNERLLISYIKDGIIRN